jgi:hypothetical protein
LWNPVTRTVIRTFRRVIAGTTSETKLTLGARVQITYWSAATATTAFASRRATLDPNELITG